MNTSEDYLQQARRCFRRAAEATDAYAVAQFAELGRLFLKLAHINAVIASSPIER